MKIPTMSTLKNIVIGVVISTMVGLAALVGIHNERNTLLKEVRVHGNSVIKSSEFDEIRKQVIGQHPDSLNMGDLTLLAMKNPYVDTVILRVEAAGALILDVMEYEALGMLIDGDREALIAHDGTVLPFRREAMTGPLPLIYGYSTRHESLEKELGFEEIARFLTESRKHELSWLTISEVTWNSEDGVVVLSQENGVKLLFGNADFDASIQKWMAFYKEVIVHKGIGAFHTIDLRFRGQIVTRETST